VVTLGCLDGGRRVNLNEKVVKGDVVLVCNETVNAGARFYPNGCVRQGRQINPGETFDEGKFWFTCTRFGRESVALKTEGCVVNGKRLKDGDRYNENDVMYECTIDVSKKDIQPTGCVQHDDNGAIIERKLGCTWVEGPSPFQYEWECYFDQTANTAAKRQVRCNYNVGNGVYAIEPGCYRLVEKNAVGCLKEGTVLKLQSFQGQASEQSAKDSGLHTC